MTKLGMNDQEITALAGQLDGQAKSLDGIITAVESLVHRAVAEWQGQDARDFEGWWHNQHKPALQNATQSVAGLAQSARNNVSAQDRASAVSSGGAGGVGGAAAVGLGGAVAAGGSVAAQSGAPSSSAASTQGAIVSKFVAAYPNGIPVGPGDTKGQCVGLFEEYSMKYVHTPEFYVGQYGDGASNFYTHYADIPGLSDAYSQLPADAVPQPGDVAVWSGSLPGSDGYGHIAIVTGQSGDSFSVLQQNGMDPTQGVEPGSYKVGSAYLLGYLRPNEAYIASHSN